MIDPTSHRQTEIDLEDTGAALRVVERALDELRDHLRSEAARAQHWADHYGQQSWDGIAKASCHRGRALAFDEVLRWLDNPAPESHGPEGGHMGVTLETEKLIDNERKGKRRRWRRR